MLLPWQLRVAGENVEQLRAECMKYREVLESRSSAVTVSTAIVYSYSNSHITYTGKV